MTQPPAPPRPLYLDISPHPVFAQLHEPGEPEASGTGVVICSPWGWDDIASYRSVRAWAEHLARAGHQTLRFDYPGTGESGGLPSDEALVEAWLGAVEGSVAWVRDLPGVSRIAVLGLGLGGLLAGASAARGAPVEDLVLWAAPVKGRTFVRTEKAFSRLQASRYTLGGEAEAPLLPDGWMETGGFILSAATLEALRDLDLSEQSFEQVERALLLDQDGISADEALPPCLRASGLEVTSGSGRGWGDMVSHPETSEPPVAVFEAVDEWLATAPRREQAAGELEPKVAPAATRPVSRADESTELRVGAAAVRESPLILERAFGRLAGTLSQPVEAGVPAGTGLCAVFLNAGAVRRIGPNRMWVEAARRWAGAGVPAVRVDLEGIGDSDGDAGRYSDVAEFYIPSLTDQVCSVLEELEERGLGREFIVVGLCSGSYWGFHAAARGARISTGILLNPQVLFWDTSVEAEREARKLARLLEPAWLLEVIRGKVSFARMQAILRALAHRARARAEGILRRRPPGEDPTPTARLEDALTDLRSSRTRLVFAFSGDEPLRTELERDGVVDRREDWPNVSFEELPARDHTLRPIVAQRAAHELLDRELERANRPRPA